MSRRFIGLTQANLSNPTGVVPVANGGTGQTQAGQYGIMIARSGIAVNHTGDTAEFILATITVPANLLTANGQIMFDILATQTGAVGTSTINLRIGGIGGTVIAFFPGQGSAGYTRLRNVLAAAGATNSQITWGLVVNGTALSSGGGAPPPKTSTADFTGAVSFVITGQLTAAADTVTLLGYNAIVYP